MGRTLAPFDPKVKPYESLRPRQQAFIDAFIQTGGNALESARQAGYKGDTQTLLRRSGDLKIQLMPYIQPYLDKIKNERIADTQEILEILTRIARGEEKDAFGLDVSNQDKIKALELLGKSNQLYTDKVKTDVDMEINVTLDEGDDE